MEKDDELVVFVDDISGKTASLLVQDLEVGFRGEAYPLVTGLNAFKMKSKGLIYVIYYTETGNEEPIKMNIASGKVNGVFIKGGTVKSYCDNGTKLIEIYDRLVELEKNFLGADISNRMYFKVSYAKDVYM